MTLLLAQLLLGLGRNFVGIEKEQEFIEISQKRKAELEIKANEFRKKIKDLVFLDKNENLLF